MLQIIKPRLTAFQPNEIYYPIDSSTVFPKNIEFTLLYSDETGEPIVGAEITVFRFVRLENNVRTQTHITFKEPTITSSLGTIKLRIPATANTLFFVFHAGNERLGVYFVQRHATLAMGRAEDEPSNAGIPRSFLDNGSATEPHTFDPFSAPDEDGLTAIEPQNSAPDDDGSQPEDIFPPVTRLHGQRIEELILGLEGQIPRNLNARLRSAEEGLHNLETLEGELTSATRKLVLAGKKFDDRMKEWLEYEPKLAEYIRQFRQERADLIGGLGTPRIEYERLFTTHLECVQGALLLAETRAGEARVAYSAKFALVASEANRVFSELHTQSVRDSVAAIAAATAEQKRVLSEHAKRLRKRIPLSEEPEPAASDPSPAAAEPVLPIPTTAPQADDLGTAPTVLLTTNDEPVPDELTPLIQRRRRRSIVPGIVLGSSGILLILGTILMLALR